MSGFENIYKHWLNWHLNISEPANKIFPSKVDSVWLVKNGPMGDVLLTTPLPKIIKMMWPTAKVTVLVNQNLVSIWEYNPYVDRIISLQRSFGLNYFTANVFELAKIAKISRQEGVDLLFSTDHEKSVSFFCKWCKPKISVGFQFPQFPEDFWSISFNENGIHRSELLKKMAAALGLDTSNWKQEIYWTPNIEKKARDMLTSSKQTIIGLAPWSGSAAKFWPFDLVVEFCKIINREGIQLALLGGKSEMEYAERLVKETSIQFVNLVGKTSLLELAVILKQLVLLVACDTGTAHLAATVDCPTITLFGPTSAAIWKPYSEKIMVVEGKRCPGCESIENNVGWAIGNCFRSEFECMNIAPEVIVKMVNEFLKGMSKIK